MVRRRVSIRLIRWFVTLSLALVVLMACAPAAPASETLSAPAASGRPIFNESTVDAYLAKQRS